MEPWYKVVGREVLYKWELWWSIWDRWLKVYRIDLQMVLQCPK